jgi:[ribosomal protein S5]-alanine N-acetyltransferase
MSNSIYIKSKRLYIRSLKIDDAENIFDYAKNINVSRYVAWDTHKSIHDSIDYIKKTIAMYKICPISNLAITKFENNDEKLIGTVGLYQNSRLSPLTYELGYILSEKWWGKGYAFEAANALVNYAFKNFNIQRIEANCVLENYQSSRIMEKLGMQREGILRKYFIKNNVIYDIYIYSILKSEWDIFR